MLIQKYIVDTLSLDSFFCGIQYNTIFCNMSGLYWIYSIYSTVYTLYMYKNRVALLRLSTNTHWSAVQQVRVFKANFFYTRPHSWLVVKGKVCREPSWRQQIQLLKTRHIFPISICSDYVHSMYSVHCTLSKNNLNLAGHGWSGCTL